MVAMLSFRPTLTVAAALLALSIASSPARAQTGPKSPAVPVAKSPAGPTDSAVAASKGAATPAPATASAAGEPRPKAADSRVEQATALHKSAAYLARTRRIRGAVIRYRRALALYKLAGDSRASDVETAIVALAKSTGTLALDSSIVPDVGYMEIAVDGFVVSRRDLSRGIALPAGTVTVTARRPGCSSWSKKVKLRARKTASLQLPVLACEGRL